MLNRVIEVNPDALYQADKADYERKAKTPGYYSGLHGIPILLKDNIGTKDKLNTTAGSFALLGSVVPRDAGVVTSSDLLQHPQGRPRLETQRWPRKAKESLNLSIICLLTVILIEFN